MNPIQAKKDDARNRPHRAAAAREPRPANPTHDLLVLNAYPHFTAVAAPYAAPQAAARPRPVPPEA